MINYSKCLLQDGTFFIGYTSLPLKNEFERVEELQGFFDEKREELYKKVIGLRKNNSNEEEEAIKLKENFYKPRYYYLFGSMDLAAICLVEGFNLPVRQYNYFGIQEKLGRREEFKDQEGFEISFSKHNLLGPTPRFSSKKNIVDLYQGIERKSKFLPLIGIIRIKLNDLFLFDYGVEFIRAYLKCLRAILSEDKDFAHNFNFLLLESYGWSEISVVIFCNSFQLIHNIIPKIRSISKKEIIERLEKSPEESDNELGQIILNTPVHSSIISNENPVCLDTYTVLGFDYDILAPVNTKSSGKNYQDAKISMKKLLQIQADDKISPIIECSLQPGHFHSTIKNLQKIQGRFFKKELEYRSLAGKSDLLMHLSKGEKIATRDFIRSIRKMGKKNLESMFVKFSTTLSFNPLENLNSDDSNDTYRIIEEFGKKLIFHSDRLSHLKKLLRKNNIPHVEQEAFLNFYAVYNNKVSNPLSFSEFLELRPFLSYMQQVIVDSVSTSPFQKLDLDGPLKTLNHAYRNRSLDNYENKDRYDYYTFLTIGAQSLVSSFDLLYKNFCAVLGNKGSFIFVEADHEFTTSNYALRLNYFHLFNPEILCAVLIQEVCNQCAFRFGVDNPDIFIFHRKFDADISGTEKIRNCLRQNGLNFGNTQYQDLSVGMNTEFFEHIFADILGVKIFYGNNLDMYLYWSWAYFSTDSNHYDINEMSPEPKINAESLSLFLLRQLIVLKVLDENRYKSYKVDFDKELSKLAKKKEARIKSFLEEFVFVGETEIWLNLVKRFSTEFIHELNKVEIDLEKFELRKKLEAGEVCIFPKKLNRLQSFLYSRHLIFSFLEAVESNGFSRKNIENRILKRGKKENFFRRLNYSDVAFDPLGGPYVINPIVRRELFKIRSAFHMSLTDMALKSKGKIIEELSNID